MIAVCPDRAGGISRCILRSRGARAWLAPSLIDAGETTDTPFFGQHVHNPRQLTVYLGLTPPEHSSGNSVRRGGITKAGSGLARHALIAGARSDRMQARVSPKRCARLEALPNAARDIA